MNTNHSKYSVQVQPLDIQIAKLETSQKLAQAVYDDPMESAERKQVAIAQLNLLNRMLVTMKVARFGTIAKHVKPL